MEANHFQGLSPADLKQAILEGVTPSTNPRLAEMMRANCSPKNTQMATLVYQWLQSYLPHCLQKIDRVSFGIMTAEDKKLAYSLDPRMPKTREKLGIPFVGKDVPSRASEFAHPDIVIGLTVLAYRYEGLRQDDFEDIIGSLRADLEKDIGPYADRRASKRHAAWVESAGGTIRGSAGVEVDDDVDESKEVVQLRLLKRSNRVSAERRAMTDLSLTMCHEAH